MILDFLRLFICPPAVHALAAGVHGGRDPQLARERLPLAQAERALRVRVSVHQPFIHVWTRPNQVDLSRMIKLKCLTPLTSRLFTYDKAQLSYPPHAMGNLALCTTQALTFSVTAG
jgi:hypothetical protein